MKLWVLLSVGLQFWGPHTVSLRHVSPPQDGWFTNDSVTLPLTDPAMELALFLSQRPPLGSKWFFHSIKSGPDDASYLLSIHKHLQLIVYLHNVHIFVCFYRSQCASFIRLFLQLITIYVKPGHWWINLSQHLVICSQTIRQNCKACGI